MPHTEFETHLNGKRTKSCNSSTFVLTKFDKKKKDIDCTGKSWTNRTNWFFERVFGTIITSRREQKGKKTQNKCVYRMLRKSVSWTMCLKYFIKIIHISNVYNTFICIAEMLCKCWWNLLKNTSHRVRISCAIAFNEVDCKPDWIWSCVARKL